MGIFRFIRRGKNTKEDMQRVTECLESIKCKVADKVGVSNFIEYEDNCVAFSGTKEDSDLLLEIYMTKCKGKSYLSGSLDDDVTWDEFDFDSQLEFENIIADYISEKFNRTIKTIIETKKHDYIRIAEYYLDKETNEWILISDNKVSNSTIKSFINKDSLEEKIKEYYLR